MVNKPEVLEDYLEGYRAWRVIGNRLYSLLKGGEYPRGVAVAECNAWTNSRTPNPYKHESPDKGCTCGLYAAWDRNEPTTSELIGISGKVKGWGKSFMASGGWRSQYQMIEYLYRPICQACSAQYRYGFRDSDEIYEATRKLKFSIEYSLNEDGTTSELALDEFLCKTHVGEIKSKNLDLVRIMLVGPNSKLDITVDNIDVKRAMTDNKYMKDIKDLSNYYEVDIKEFNNENN